MYNKKTKNTVNLKEMGVFNLSWEEDLFIVCIDGKYYLYNPCVGLLFVSKVSRVTDELIHYGYEIKYVDDMSIVLEHVSQWTVR